MVSTFASVSLKSAVSLQAYQFDEEIKGHRKHSSWIPAESTKQWVEHILTIYVMLSVFLLPLSVLKLVLNWFSPLHTHLVCLLNTMKRLCLSSMYVSFAGQHR